MNTIIKEEQKMNENYRIGSVQPEWGKGRAQTLYSGSVVKTKI